jgi:hypothetical protein
MRYWRTSWILRGILPMKTLPRNCWPSNPITNLKGYIASPYRAIADQTPTTPTIFENTVVFPISRSFGGYIIRKACSFCCPVL